MDAPPSTDTDLQTGKKRKNTSSARGVNSLTPEQLAKKRANDREAQRAIRERTKAQIEGLERRIEELTSQKPYQELQTAIRQKEQVQAENEGIKKRLASILAIIQPILEIQDPTTAKDSLSSTPNHQQQFSPVNGGSQLSHRTWSQTCSESSTLSADWNNSHDSTQFNERSLPQIDFQKNNLQNGPGFYSGEKLPLTMLTDRNQHISNLKGSKQSPERSFISPTALPPLYPPSSLQTLQYPDYTFAVYSTLPRNNEPTCPLDTIMLDFLHARQREAAEGAPSQTLVGPAYPSISSLLNPEKSVYSHPLSKVLTDVLSKFPDISEVPEKVATLYTMFWIMRWLVKPTEENYSQLPDWMAPRASQVLTAHPAWIDYLPWPKMRDTLVVHQQDYLFENFFVPYTTTLSLNWPYEPAKALLTPSSNGDELMINPVFERHLRDLNNWSLGEAFAKAHPGLAPTCRIKR